jgi:hypothetical protein
MNSVDSNNVPKNIVLHFDSVRGNNEFLPWEYQIQAIEANIIYTEEALQTNQKKYNYYNALLSLSENLLNEIKNNTLSYNTAQEFFSFLTNTIGKYKDTELNDYIDAYVHKTESVISNNTPLVENPRIYQIPKGIVKKSFIICVVLLMATTLVAFLMEAAQKNKHLFT